MRIAFVSEHASPLACVGGLDTGGQNVHVAELAAALVRAGHTVTVFTRRDAEDMPTRVTTASGYDVVHVSAGPAAYLPRDELWPLMPTFADALGAGLDEETFDLVHAHFWMSGWATLQASVPRGIPTALTFHALGVVKRRELGPDDPSPAGRLEVEQDLARSVELVVATCSDEVNELRESVAAPRRFSVVPCGVDVELFTPNGPALGERRLPYRIVALGRMVPRKGYATAVEALVRLPQAELILAGGSVGPDVERNRLQALAEDLGVGDRVRLLPQVPRRDVPSLLRSADVVAALPWYEPFGIVPVEAMACGVPVVGSAVGGLLDTVQDGVTGTLVPPRDPVAAAEAIDFLLRRPRVRASYGRAAALRARAAYSWDSVAARTVDAYRQILEPAASEPLTPAAVAL